MKKRFTFLAIMSVLFLGNNTVLAQAGIKRANKNYDKYAYFDAINIYEKIANRGFVDPDLLKNIGDSYYFNANYENANKWYSQLYTEYDTLDFEAEYDFRFAQTLLNVGDNEKANIYFKKFAEKNKNSSRAKIINSRIQNKLDIKNNSGRYDINNLDINSVYSDYGASFHKDKVLFTTSRDTGNFTKRVFTWTGDAFSNIYEADLLADGNLSIPKLFSKTITSKFNESSPIITKDGKTMYFTRNNYNNGKRGFDEGKVTLLKIYRAELVDGNWINITELPFNSNNFNTAHPVLNEDENIMYFASDRPGGYGSSDIWQVSLKNKDFGDPFNLGPEINTDGRETFPYITSNNELYFSSDARLGLGGLDVFVSKLKPNGTFTRVQNVGTPVNSNSDDFAYIIDKSTKRGFFSSNRVDGKGKDDIYSFIENRELVLECLRGLKVKVVDAVTKSVITTANVHLYETNYTPKSMADALKNSGFYIFDSNLECDSDYRLRVGAPTYIVKEQLITINSNPGIQEIVIELEPQKVEIKPKDDLFKVFNLKPIYFDLDKDNIRPDAAIELAKIVEIMKEYPEMKVDIRSHTDSRASDSYNLKLSQRRAKSTANWIASQGIESYRLTYQGYGESQLINKCSNGVKCTDEEHEQNRRSEFIVEQL